MTFEARDLSVLTLASVEASREALNKWVTLVVI
jgi:hypothetical protein